MRRPVCVPFRPDPTFIKLSCRFEAEAAATPPSLSVDVRIDPRVREQEWGTIDSMEDMEKIVAQRERVGRFFFRFPNGESGAGDVLVHVDYGILFMMSIVFVQMFTTVRHPFSRYSGSGCDSAIWTCL